MSDLIALQLESVYDVGLLVTSNRPSNTSTGEEWHICSFKASGGREFTRSHRRQTVECGSVHGLATVATGKFPPAARLNIADRVKNGNFPCYSSLPLDVGRLNAILFVIR